MVKKNILLIYPAYTYPRKSPPLGLAYLASYIERKGFNPFVVDFNISTMDDNDFKELLLSKPWLLVGISFMTSQFAEASRLSSFIKKILPETPLAAGGPHPSSIPERTLREIPAIDIIIRGEGEETLGELTEALSFNNSIEDIPGLCFRGNNEIKSNINRPLIADMDKLPFPTWNYFDVKKYNVFTLASKNNAPVFALLSSRGCPNFCTFCDSHTVFERKFRPRSAQNIFDEIMYLYNTYSMLEFDFVDDLITINKRRVLELCGLISKSGIPFKWMANARVNTVDREMLQAMKDAGCIRVDFGVETGDPYVRKLMKKNITDEQIKNAHKIAKDVGLSTGSFTMVGNLGETRESAKMTVELLKDIGDDVMVSITCPYPGTELYRIAKEKGLINTEDWSRYVTSPTYTKDFYPVMRTENMTEKEILNSFYYIHSFFAQKKFQRRFGHYFLLNPRFYKEWIFKPEGFTRRFKMAAKLIVTRMR